MLNWPVSASLFRVLAKTLVKLLKLKVGKPNKRKSSAQVETSSDAHDSPPAYWLEKVAKGAPHLLVQPDENPPSHILNDFHPRPEIKHPMHNKKEGRVIAKPTGNNNLNPREGKSNDIKKIDSKPYSQTVPKIAVDTARKIKQHFSKIQKDVANYAHIVNQNLQSNPEFRSTNDVLNSQTKLNNLDKSDDNVIRRNLKTGVLVDNTTTEFNTRISLLPSVRNNREDKVRVIDKPEQTLKNTKRLSQNPVHLYPHSKVCSGPIAQQKKDDFAKKSNKVDRVAASGNSVIPQQAYLKNADTDKSTTKDDPKLGTSAFFANTPVQHQAQAIAAESYLEKTKVDVAVFDSGIEKSKPHKAHLDSFWTNLPKDRPTQTDQDPWPTLPDEGASHLTNNGGGSTNIWKVLQDNKHNHLSDKEQRSHLWNG